MKRKEWMREAFWESMKLAPSENEECVSLLGWLGHCCEEWQAGHIGWLSIDALYWENMMTYKKVHLF